MNRKMCLTYYSYSTHTFLYSIFLSSLCGAQLFLQWTSKSSVNIMVPPPNQEITVRAFDLIAPLWAHWVCQDKMTRLIVAAK